MPTERESNEIKKSMAYIKKSMAYDLINILEENPQQATYTAEEVKKLADEIRILTEEVNKSLSSVDEESTNLSVKMEESVNALDKSIEETEASYSSFDDIVSSANGTDAVQQEIADAAETASTELKKLESDFDSLNSQYDILLNKLERVNDLGTTKSGIFENIDNLLSQIAPMMR